MASWQDGLVGRFRYAQFCALACAAEIVGERWTLLILRELFLGPQRFSDLRRRLPGLSSSVLADRLVRLEERSVIVRRIVAPPTPAAIYEMAPLGRELETAVAALARWGAHFMSTRRPDDHAEPDWVRLGLNCFARSEPTPPRTYAIRIPDAGGEVALRVEGGPAGTTVRQTHEPGDVLIRAKPVPILELAAGADPEGAIRRGAIQAEGDLDALAAFSSLFRVSATIAGSGAVDPSPSNPKGV